MINWTVTTQNEFGEKIADYPFKGNEVQLHRFAYRMMQHDKCARFKVTRG